MCSTPSSTPNWTIDATKRMSRRWPCNVEPLEREVRVSTDDTMTGPNAAIAIVCKVPKAGFSKTRLIPTLGPDAAAALSRAFLIDLAGTIEEVARDVGASGYAVCSPADAAEELATFLPATFGYAVHTNPVLGAVLDAATGDLLGRGHDCVLLVNGDSPTLPASILRDSVRALRHGEECAVFSPAVDGGYVLVGLRRRCPALFADIPWSTPAVMARSLDQARSIGLPATMVDSWYDVDDAESLSWLMDELRGEPPAGLGHRGAAAMATRAVLEAARQDRETVFGP